MGKRMLLSRGKRQLCVRVFCLLFACVFLVQIINRRERERERDDDDTGGFSSVCVQFFSFRIKVLCRYLMLVHLRLHSVTFYYYHLLTKPLNKERNSSGFPFLLVRGFVASPLFPPTRISELKLTRHRSKATPLKPSETNRKEISGTWKVATERTITPIGTPSKMVFPTEGKIFPSLSTPLRRLLSPNAPWAPNKYDAAAQPRINGDAVPTISIGFKPSP